MSDELPLGETFSDEELQSRFVLVADEHPFDMEALAYQVLLPRDWGHDTLRAEEPEIGTEQLLPIGVFGDARQDPPTTQVQIQVVRLAREIAAADWLRFFLAVTDREIETVEAESPWVADSVSTFPIDGVPFTARCSVTISGDLAFVLLGFCPADAYEDVADVLGLAVRTFRPTSEPERATIEPRATVLLDPAREVAFEAPASWKVHRPEGTSEGLRAVDLHSFDDEGALNGWIRVKLAYPPARSANQLTLLREEIEEAGATLGDEEIHRAPVGRRGEMVVLPAELEGPNPVPQQVWLVHNGPADRSVVLGMLTPGPRTHFYPWAVNRRALELVLESLTESRLFLPTG